MRTIYVILATAGWSWFLLVMVYLAIHLRRRRRGGAEKGFDVVMPNKNEKQH